MKVIKTQERIVFEEVQRNGEDKVLTGDEIIRIVYRQEMILGPIHILGG